MGGHVWEQKFASIHIAMYEFMAKHTECSARGLQFAWLDIKTHEGGVLLLARWTK